MKQRPFAVTILAVLAGIAAVFAVLHLLQALGILPYFFGSPLQFRDFNLWYVIMWGLMVWVWVWVTVRTSLQPRRDGPPGPSSRSSG